MEGNERYHSKIAVKRRLATFCAKNVMRLMCRKDSR